MDAAIALDSGFIPVLRQRMGVAISANDTALTRRLRETMRRHEHRATEFDRLHQEVSDAYVNGERERSEALARRFVRRYPRDPRAYHLLWDILGSHGNFAEAGRVLEQALALDSLAIEAGPGPCAPCVGLFAIVGLHWARHDFDGAAEWARRWIRAQPDAASSWAALAWTYSYMQRPDSALPLMARAVSLSGGDTYANGEYIRMLLVARRYDAADSAITVMEGATTAERRETAADLRSILERERGRIRASMQVIDRMAAELRETMGFADMIRADNQRLLGDYRGAARRFEAATHGPSDPLPLPVPAAAARAYCWHHALAADALAPTGDTIALRAIADTLQKGCSRSYYGRDWRLYHHVRGLIAMHGRRYAEAEREFEQAVWVPVGGWTRTTVELAEAQAALGRPLDAIFTLRIGYATRLDAMGRYVPISEFDYRMARIFAQAGQQDSARVYAAYVRSAWRDADPEIRRLLDRLP
jgi:tetratricopeptide (TPR) repeat protein